MEKYDKKEIGDITIYSKENGDVIEIENGIARFYNFDGRGNMTHTIEDLNKILREKIKENYVSKQKIKDKIEEVKNEEDLYARGNIIAILSELLEE